MASAYSAPSDITKLLGDVRDKLTSVETKLTAVDRELSTVKLDQRRLHDAVKAEKKAAFPIELRLPEYDGTDDPAVWLHRFEIFFSLQRTEDDDKVSLAAFHMTGAAQIWYCELKRNCGVPTWQQFAELVRLRFGAPTHGNKTIGEILTEEELTAMFIAGLREPLMRAELKLRRPATVQEAYQLALELEHRYN